MPGIVGLITAMPRQQAELELRRMVAAIHHEPFYETGTWCDADLGVYVGWTARQESFAAGMPLENDRGTSVLVFSGEEFSEQPNLAHRAEHERSFPAGLNGRFHGLLVDRHQGTATLFNDRYGMHRIYHHQSKDAFYFAAEAKAILAVRPELRRIDAYSLGEFLACGCVLQDRSLFEDLRLLPGASRWVFRGRTLERKDTYFRPREWEDQPVLAPEAYYEELRTVFARTLPRYFNGREPVGLSLTGGLDTRMILAWHKPAPGSMPCYTFGGMFRDCHDVIVGRQVASACGQPHQVIPVGQDFLARFSHYAARAVYLTDGCVDVSRTPDLYVNERARQIAPVRMTGNYGGEVLRRVRAFKPVPLQPGLFAPELLAYTGVAAETYRTLLDEHPLTFAVFRQAPWHHYGLLSLEQTQLSLRSPYLDNEFVRTVFRAPQSTLTNNDICLRLIADGDMTLRRIRTDRGDAGPARVYRPAFRQLFEFQFKAEYAYDYGMPQWMAGIDHALSPLHLERLFLGRHKFYHFRVWYRDALAPYLKDVLLDPKSRARPYLEPNQLETIVRSHINGHRNYTTAIHKVLTLELLHRQFLD